jgi:hypothetical protein
MIDHAAMIDKLERSAASERACGNHDAASTFELKADKLRRKYNLPRTEPVNEPINQPAKPQPKVQQDYWGNFPGVPPPEAPLSNEQLNALRAAAAGRALSDNERDAVLGKKTKEGGNILWI